MNAYILIIIADILLTITLITQKSFQQRAGTSLDAALVYNSLMGVFSTIMFLLINRFTINISAYSVILGTLYTLIMVLYIFIGFEVMKSGNVSTYTMFLLSGGMIVPYIWGIVFLKEEVTLLRTVGLIMILIAIVASNYNKTKMNIKHIILCLAVFILNGMNCVISKVHQISEAGRWVSASDFAFIIMIVKAILCSIVVVVRKSANCFKTGVRLSVRTIVPIVLISALSDGISYVLQLVVASSLPATILYPFVTGGAVVLTAFAGSVLLKEKLSLSQWIGITFCFAGTFMFL